MKQDCGEQKSGYYGTATLILISSISHSQAYEWVLHKAQQLEWSEHSAKALVMIGDALPHEVSYTDQKINWHNELDILKGMGIKVCTNWL